MSPACRLVLLACLCALFSSSQARVFAEDGQLNHLRHLKGLVREVNEDELALAPADDPEDGDGLAITPADAPEDGTPFIIDPAPVVDEEEEEEEEDEEDAAAVARTPAVVNATSPAAVARTPAVVNATSPAAVAAVSAEEDDEDDELDTLTQAAEKSMPARSELDKKLVNATKRVDLEEVLAYLELGANVNVKYGFAKRTPLHIAANTGSVEITEALIEAGADVDALTKGNATALHVAAADNKPGVAQVLIDNGADMEATTNDGNTPLHWASTQGHPDVAEVLLLAGADRYMINKEGDTAKEILCCCQCGEESNCTCKDRGALVWWFDVWTG